MYNIVWKDWVLGTAHQDNFPWRGRSEDVEDYLAAIADSDNNWDVYEDEIYLYNYDDDTFAPPCCFYDCDGWETIIDIP